VRVRGILDVSIEYAELDTTANKIRSRQTKAVADLLHKEDARGVIEWFRGFVSAKVAIAARWKVVRMQNARLVCDCVGDR
jgi:hypothetical protein